jgi:hypothetical protein
VESTTLRGGEKVKKVRYSRSRYVIVASDGRRRVALVRVRFFSAGEFFTQLYLFKEGTPALVKAGAGSRVRYVDLADLPLLKSGRLPTFPKADRNWVWDGKVRSAFITARSPKNLKNFANAMMALA